MARYAALIAGLALVLVLGNLYAINILMVVALHALPALGLSLLMGYTGQISLGHAAFYGLGAYASALISLRLGLSPWISLVVAAALVGSIAWLVGRIIFRFRGHYLAMATLALGIIVHIGMVELSELTGGPNGMSGIPALAILGTPVNTDVLFFPIAWAFCLGLVVLAEKLVDSPTGLAMKAVSDNERVAASLGTDISAFKRTVFAISAVYASIGGSLYAHYVGYLSPGPFDVGFSIRLLVMVAIGGFANIWGVLFGVAFVTVIGELLKPLGHFDVVVYGVLLVAVMVFCPEGLFTGILRLARSVRGVETQRRA